jgi:GH15 family glucan-1,4-alpha-glucosidase
VLDGRGKEPDGVGWSLWAAWEVSRAAPDPGEQRRVLSRLQPLITRSVAATVQLTGATGSPVRLPAPGLDYWEVEERTLTLGVAAPLLAGSAAAAKIYAVLGDGVQAERLHTRHDRLATAVTAAFGPYYPRHQGRGAADQDAAVAFLLPPFTDPGDAVDPAVERARQTAVAAMRRPAGGLAPGVAWPADGISWTPETALFALAAASVNRQEEAREWLDFLLAHRTGAGSLPEKVLRDGTPAAASPLAWTGACVVLAVAALTDPADE